MIQEVAQDTTQAAVGGATAYDSVWAAPGAVPTQAPTGLEGVMLADDKLFVVLAVALIIWIGLIVVVLRTDRRLTKLEQSLPDRIPTESERV